MPVVLRHGAYRYYFYADEGDPREPVHIHVRRGNSEAKFWLRPFVTVAYNRRVPTRDMAEIIRVIQRNWDLIERAWNAFFYA